MANRLCEMSACFGVTRRVVSYKAVFGRRRIGVIDLLRAAVKLSDATATNEDCHGAIPGRQNSLSMAILTFLLLRYLVLRSRCCEHVSRAEEPLVGNRQTSNNTSALTPALLGCVKATSTITTWWNQACSHGKLSQWHGKLHEQLALHFKLFSMKTGSLPVLDPPLNICSSFMPSKREKSKSSHRCLGIGAVRVGEACSC